MGSRLISHLYSGPPANFDRCFERFRVWNSVERKTYKLRRIGYLLVAAIQIRLPSAPLTQSPTVPPSNSDVTTLRFHPIEWFLAECPLMSTGRQYLSAQCLGPLLFLTGVPTGVICSLVVSTTTSPTSTTVWTFESND